MFFDLAKPTVIYQKIEHAVLGEALISWLNEIQALRLRDGETIRDSMGMFFHFNEIQAVEKKYDSAEWGPI